MSEQTKDKMIKLLEEILKWTKFEGMQKARELLISVLDNDTKKLVYQLSDGKSSPQIAKIAKVSAWTVRDYWNSWGAIGITEIHPEYKKRHRHVFSLDKLGIECPPIPVIEKKNKENEEKVK